MIDSDETGQKKLDEIRKKKDTLRLSYQSMTPKQKSAVDRLWQDL